MVVTSMEALQLSKPTRDRQSTQPNNETQQTTADKGITKVEAEKMLDALVAQGWFEKSRKGFYGLSPRALMELRSWLIDMYNDPPEEDDSDEERESRTPKIKFCFACKEIVTMVRTRIRNDMSHRFLHQRRDSGALSPLVKVESTQYAPRTFSRRKSSGNARVAKSIGWVKAW